MADCASSHQPGPRTWKGYQLGESKPDSCPCVTPCPVQLTEAEIFELMESSKMAHEQLKHDQAAQVALFFSCTSTRSRTPTWDPHCPSFLCITSDHQRSSRRVWPSIPHVGHVAGSALWSAVTYPLPSVVLSCFCAVLSLVAHLEPVLLAAPSCDTLLRRHMRYCMVWPRCWCGFCRPWRWLPHSLGPV